MPSAPSFLWQVATARTHEASLADDLLGVVKERVAAQTATLDKGYDTQPVHDACERNGMFHVIPLKDTPRQARRAQAADLRARYLDVRGCRRAAQPDEVAPPLR